MTRDMNPSSAVVLLSGGLDSSTCLFEAVASDFEPLALSFDYGQRHRRELESARLIAADAGVKEHVILPLDLTIFGGSALTDDIEVPKDRSLDEDEVPVTYVPGRNIIFLSCALSFAESRGCSDIFIGVNAIDYSGYPDCRGEFIEAFVKAANLGTQAGSEGREFTIHAPLKSLSKKQIVNRALTLGVDLAKTFSCYDPTESGSACGRCDSCRLRARGFAAAGVVDPALDA